FEEESGTETKNKNEKNVQKDIKSSSDRSSNQNQKSQKVKNENSKIVGNKWCRSDHSAQKPNPANLRKEYHQARQCFDLSVWCKMVYGMITGCVTAADITDTLLLTANIGVMRPGGAIIAISKVTLPEIAQGDRMTD
ncbi:hypothetical protein NP026_23770, partial [Salmonella enterica]|nr:hypothetical protein [Salmonella enterica]